MEEPETADEQLAEEDVTRADKLDDSVAEGEGLDEDEDAADEE